MITDQLVRERFVHDIMSQGINLIYETQEKVVRTYLNSRSGDLVAHLQKRPFIAQESDTEQAYCVYSHISASLTSITAVEPVTVFPVIFAVILLFITGWSGECCIMRHSRK